MYRDDANSTGRLSIRTLIRKFSPKWARQGFWRMFTQMRASAICEAIPFHPVSDKSALVVAPHPDDETFACGGLIRLKRAAGARVRVIGPTFTR